MASQKSEDNTVIGSGYYGFRIEIEAPIGSANFDGDFGLFKDRLVKKENVENCWCVRLMS